MLSRVLTIIICLETVWSAARLEPLAPKPKEFEGKEGCYIEDINDVIPFGKSISGIDDCFKIKCGEDHVYFESCPPQLIDPSKAKCKIKEDLSKTYPACCRVIYECDEEVD